MEMTLQYGTTPLNFKVVFKNRKTMEIAIETSGKIVVTVPTGTSEEVIKQKVRDKANWLIKKQFIFRNMQIHKINREFVNGESFMYMGRNYTLQILIDESIKIPIAKLFQGKFYVTTPIKDEVLIERAMKEWYKNKAKEQIEGRIEYYQPYFSKKPMSIKIKEQKKRWGSCTNKNELLFNWRCVIAKSHALDYIIVHEMCHMYHKDHSKYFWDLIASVMPDYEIRREWLKNNGINLDL